MRWTEIFPDTLPKQQFKPGDRLQIRAAARSAWEYNANGKASFGPWTAIEVVEQNDRGYDGWLLSGLSNPDAPVSEQWLERVGTVQPKPAKETLTV